MTTGTGTRVTYAADEALAGALLLRLAEMSRFDHGARVAIEAAALPYTIAARPQAGMMPCDRRAVGFDEPRDYVGPTAAGLTRDEDARLYRPDGQSVASREWQAMLDAWNRRPPLADVLGAHGLPSVVTDERFGVMSCPIIVLTASSDDLRAAAPVLIRYAVAPPDTTHLVPFDDDEFDRVAATMRRTIAARTRT